MWLINQDESLLKKRQTDADSLFQEEWSLFSQYNFLKKRKEVTFQEIKQSYTALFFEFLHKKTEVQALLAASQKLLKRYSKGFGTLVHLFQFEKAYIVNMNSLIASVSLCSTPELQLYELLVSANALECNKLLEEEAKPMLKRLMVEFPEAVSKTKEPYSNIKAHYELVSTTVQETGEVCPYIEKVKSRAIETCNVLIADQLLDSLNQKVDLRTPKESWEKLLEFRTTIIPSDLESTFGADVLGRIPIEKMSHFQENFTLFLHLFEVLDQSQSNENAIFNPYPSATREKEVVELEMILKGIREKLENGSVSELSRAHLQTKLEELEQEVDRINYPIIYERNKQVYTNKRIRDGMNEDLETRLKSVMNIYDVELKIKSIEKDLEAPKGSESHVELQKMFIKTALEDIQTFKQSTQQQVLELIEKFKETDKAVGIEKEALRDFTVDGIATLSQEVTNTLQFIAFRAQSHLVDDAIAGFIAKGFWIREAAQLVSTQGFYIDENSAQKLIGKYPGDPAAEDSSCLAKAILMEARKSVQGPNESVKVDASAGFLH